jgi:hypothetical protein
MNDNIVPTILGIGVFLAIFLLGGTILSPSLETRTREELLKDAKRNYRTENEQIRYVVENYYKKEMQEKGINE